VVVGVGEADSPPGDVPLPKKVESGFLQIVKSNFLQYKEWCYV
jgi:hypothetical protein